MDLELKRLTLAHAGCVAVADGAVGSFVEEDLEKKE